MKFRHSDSNYCQKVIGQNISAITVIIHQPDQFPTYFHDKITIDITGNVTNLYVKAKSQKTNENLRVLDPHVRKCYFDDERKLKYFKRYSKQYCILECQLKISECDPLEIPKKTEKFFCPASWPMMAYVESDYNESDSCKCYPNCNYLQFKIRKSVEFQKDENETAVWLKFDDGGEDYSKKFMEESENFMAYTITNCRFLNYSKLVLN